MNKQVLEIKELFNVGNIDINDEFEIIEKENVDGFEYEIAHRMTNNESIKLVFPAHEHYAELKEKYDMGEIDYDEFIKQDNSNELSDQYDYYNLIAVIIDEERYDF